jgi:RND family efflux transporter MFP subunit
MNLADLSPLANHLWQSTLFGAAAWLLTLALAKNRAAIRYWIWLAASVKFLIPFSWLIDAGSHLAWRANPAIRQPVISAVMDEMSRPFALAAPAAALAPAAQPPGNMAEILLLGVWLCGFAIGVIYWLRGLLRIRATRRAAAPLDLNLPIPVMSSSARLEPGVFGIRRPVLLLPEGITERLAPEQLEAVIAHELCHVRRRDNLTGTIHLFVEAVFWFHPLLWWIRTRLVKERERACDEEVLRLGSEPHVYAEAILNVCKLYLECPLLCVSGVAGSNLKKRIQTILSGRMAGELSLAKRVALATAAIAALALPVVIGVMNAPAIGAQVQPSAFAAAPIDGKPAAPAQAQATSSATPVPAYLSGLGAVSATSVTVRPQVDGTLMSLNYKEGEPVQAGQVLATIDPRPFQLQLQRAEGQMELDDGALAAARTYLAHARNQVAAGLVPEQELVKQTAAVSDLEGRLKTDQTSVENAKRQLSYAQVVAPMTGVAGLRLIDPGNIVYAADSTGIVVINQLQPIAVLFNIPEEDLPQVMARLKQGAGPPVEAWNRANTIKIATGRLTAVDNQIDATTGTAKLKAVFDNKDGALFPNQFVNVHLFLNSK